MRGGGRFVDSFFLGPGRALMAVRDGIVFCQEKNEDETIALLLGSLELGKDRLENMRGK
jgi:hypothetical protein